MRSVSINKAEAAMSSLISELDKKPSRPFGDAPMNVFLSAAAFMGRIWTIGYARNGRSFGLRGQK